MSSVSIDTTSWIWDGQRLASPVAVSLFTVAAQPHDRPIILFASVADLQNYGLVSTNRFAEFLVQHADCSFICENAAQFHWIIHQDAQRLGDAAAIQDTLWRRSEDHRLLDVQLFEQLVQLARSGTETDLRPLADLMAAWCHCPWEPPDVIAEEAFRRGDFRAFPPELLTRACGVARSLWNLFSALSQSAAQAAMGGSPDSPYGPLGLGIQTKARIALEKPRPWPILDESHSADVIAALEHDIQQQTPGVRKLHRLVECLKWDQDRLALDSDLPRINDRMLRQMLVEVGSQVLGVDAGQLRLNPA